MDKKVCCARLLNFAKLFWSKFRKRRKEANRYIKYKAVVFYSTEISKRSPYELYHDFIDIGVDHNKALEYVSDARYEFISNNNNKLITINREHLNNTSNYIKIVTDYNEKRK